MMEWTRLKFDDGQSTHTHTTISVFRLVCSVCRCNQSYYLLLPLGCTDIPSTASQRFAIQSSYLQGRLARPDTYLQAIRPSILSSSLLFYHYPFSFLLNARSSSREPSPSCLMIYLPYLLPHHSPLHTSYIIHTILHSTKIKQPQQNGVNSH